jgi:flagellar hook-length control protein FliK
VPGTPAAQATERAPEDEKAALSAEAPETPLAALHAALHSTVIAHAPGASHDEHAAASSPSLAASLDAARGKDGTDVAAHAATIAGAGEADPLPMALDGDARPGEAPAPGDALQSASTDASAPLGHLLLGGTEKTQAAQPSAMLEVAPPVDGPEFAQALSQQVVWMADKDAQVAELRINPPELGPVEVRLQLSGDEAVVQFASAHAEVRSAIEAAVARLRESMAQAGIQLGETSVSAESFREQAGHSWGHEQSRAGYGQGGERTEPSWTPSAIAHGVRRGLVDLFA